MKRNYAQGERRVNRKSSVREKKVRSVVSQLTNLIPGEKHRCDTYCWSGKSYAPKLITGIKNVSSINFSNYWQITRVWNTGNIKASPSLRVFRK